MPGVLCGEEPVGVAATTDRGRDPRARRPTACCTCRARSTSTTSSRCSSRAPTSSRPAASCSRGGQRARRRRSRPASLDACARGGSSIYATGQQPRVHHRRASVRAAVDAAPRRVDRDRGVRQSVAARLAAPAVRADGFGRPVDVVRRRATRRTSSASSGRRSALLAEAAGRPVDAWTCNGRGRGRARRPRRIVGRRAAGRDRSPRSARRSSARSARRRGRALHARTGTARPTSSRRGICGRPGGACACTATRRFDVDLPFPIPLDDLGSFTPAYTANRPVNAIPYVCAAPPGILVTADLPPITPAGPRHALNRSTAVTDGGTAGPASPPCRAGTASRPEHRARAA